MFTTVALDVAGDQKRSVMELDSRIEYTENPDTVIRFTEIPNKLPSDITPQERSKYSMDSTFFLERFISVLPNGMYIC